MQNLLMAIVLSGVACAWLGVHVTLRKMSFFGDALAHSTLPGVVLAHVFGLHMLLGALVSALTAVLGVGWAARSPKTSHDSVIGVAYTGLFAAGVIGMYHFGNSKDLTHILIGNPLGVSAEDVQIIAICSGVVMLTLAVTHRLLTTTLIDRQHAVSIGHSPSLAQAIVLVLTAITVVTAITAVGLILTLALLITPAATARLCCQRLFTMIITAITLSLGAGLLGILLSWHLNWPAGATVVLGLSSFYVLLRMVVALPLHRFKNSSAKP